MNQGEEPEIPKLPRAKLFRGFSIGSVARIGTFAVLLYAIVVTRKPCAASVGRFFGGFDPAQDASLQTVPGYELMTAEEALKRWPDSPDASPLAEGDAGSEASDSAATTPAGDDHRAPPTDAPD